MMGMIVIFFIGCHSLLFKNSVVVSHCRDIIGFYNHRSCNFNLLNIAVAMSISVTVTVTMIMIWAMTVAVTVTSLAHTLTFTG